jgi:hypothetical protein
VPELVANVIDHVRGEASLTLEPAVSDGWLRIAVVDGSSIPRSSGSWRRSRDGPLVCRRPDAGRTPR